MSLAPFAPLKPDSPPGFHRLRGETTGRSVWAAPAATGAVTPPEGVSDLGTSAQTARDDAPRVMQVDNVGSWIVRDPGICGGDPSIAGTRIGVHDVVALARRYRWNLGRVRTEELSHLSAEQIDAAVAWYRAHSAEVDAILRRRRANYRRLLKRIPATR